MKYEQWLRKLLDETMSLSPDERPAFLETQCGGNAAALEEVLARLRDQIADGSSDDRVDSNDPRVTPTLNTAPARTPPREPVQIGPYRILEKIGEGGMGTVYRAEQRGAIRRQVAVKLIRAGMDTKQVLARFDAEKNALSLMNHPSIARVLDSGQTDEGWPYFVMEYVDGTPFTEFCRRERLPLEDRLRLFQQVCEGVQHAHTKAVVHRDLKPANILVTRLDGNSVPKIIDFGLAKALTTPLTDMTMVTFQRQIMGTLDYMSPEQAGSGGTDVDTRTDIYALGVILYELLVDQLPFDLRKKGDDEIFRTIREVDPPRPSVRLSQLSRDESSRLAEGHGIDSGRLRSRLQGELDWIVLKALEKQRDRRYVSALAMAEDIERHVVGHEPVVARPPSAIYRLKKLARRYRMPVIAGGTILAVLVVSLIVSLWALEGKRQATKDASLRADEAEAAQKAESIARKEAEQRGRVARERLILSEARGLLQSDPSLIQLVLREMPEVPESPLGLKFIVGRVADKNGLLRYRLIGHDSDIFATFWSPDGSKVLTASRDDTARIWDLRADGPVVLRHERLSSAGWGPDGSRVATTSYDGTTRIWQIDGGDPLVIGSQESPAFGLTWSPDGSRIATMHKDGAVSVWKTDGSGHPTVIPDAGTATWSPDGKHLAMGLGGAKVQVWRVGADEPTVLFEGPSPLLPGSARPAQTRTVAWSPDSARILTCSPHLVRIWRVDDLANPTETLKEERFLVCAEWSPDGSRVMTISYFGDVSVWSVDGRGEPRFLEQAAWAVWSPDGSRVATTSREGTRIWALDRDEEPIVLDHDDTKSVGPAVWSPDGSRVITNQRGSAAVWNANGIGEPIVVQPEWELGSHSWIHAMAWSPDGSLLMATSGNCVRLWCFEGKNRPTTLRTGASPQEALWSSNGSRVLIRSDRNVLVWNTDETSEPIVLAHGRAVESAAWNPSATRVLTSDGSQATIWNTDGTGESIVWDAREASWSPDGSRVLLTTGSRLRILNADDTGEAIVLDGTKSYRASWSPDGKRVLAETDPPSSLYVWDADGGAPPLVIGNEQGDQRISGARWSSDGSRIVGTTSAGTVLAWNADGGESVVLARGQEKPGLSWSQDGSRLLAVDRPYAHTRNGRVSILDATMARLPITLGEYSTHAYFSPDGSSVLRRDSSTGTFWVWSGDAADAEVAIGKGVEGAWSPDGSRVAIAMYDSSILIWNMATIGKPDHLLGRSGQVQLLAWSPDGQRLLSADREGTIIVWPVQWRSIRNRLWRDTNDFLRAPEREQYLGEMPKTARAREAADREWIRAKMEAEAEGRALPLPRRLENRDLRSPTD